MLNPEANPHSFVPWLDQYLGRLVALGLDKFVDRRDGGFHEALDEHGAPAHGARRLLVQCRQIYVNSHAAQLGLSAECLAVAARGVDFITDRYWDAEKGGWYFSVGEDGSPADRTRDLYAHAFVVFALAHFHDASGDSGALAGALTTLRLILDRFADPVSGGFHEALDAQLRPVPRVRRQNPHMHLMEGALALAQATGNPDAAQLADQLYALLRERFIDPETGTLGEFFTDSWQPHPAEGHQVEPGHHFEWAWILEQYSRLTRVATPLELADDLREWAWQRGLNPSLGGVHDGVDRRGDVLRDTQRIWPQLESAKAFAVHWERTAAAASRERLVQIVDHLRKRFLKPDGSWVEQLDRTGRAASNRLPGSTGYHLFLGLSEARRALAGAPPPAPQAPSW